MCKMEWFEEQRTTKQAAVENAVKLTSAEWKAKLESTVDKEVEERLNEGSFFFLLICILQTFWLIKGSK